MSRLPGYDEALERALAGAEPLGESEPAPLALASGRILAEPITADRDLPPFNRAQMDGYAVRGAEIGAQATWPIAATVPAGQPGPDHVPPGACVAIATGAPVPPDLDVVVPHEQSDRGDPVSLDADGVEVGHAIHPRGADARAGDVLLEPGQKLASAHLAIAAAVGRERVRVRRRPRVIVLTSGDEVRPIAAPLAPHQIRNTNAPMLLDLLARLGAEPYTARHLVDEREPTIAGVGQALAEADLVVTVGGVSAGARDHFPAAFEAHGLDRRLIGAAIQPGKPINVARHGDGAWVVALPGNPVSALACTCLFVWPLVHRLLGATAPLPWRALTLAEPVRPNPRRQAFRPARRTADDQLVVPAWAGSGDLVHTATTEGLVRLPVQAEDVPAGTMLPFLPFP